MVEARREANAGVLNSQRRSQPASPSRAVCIRVAALSHRSLPGNGPIPKYTPCVCMCVCPRGSPRTATPGAVAMAAPSLPARGPCVADR